MTLGALAVGIDLVIDDAIVVVENVFRQLSHGESRDVAVRNAADFFDADDRGVFLPLTLLAGMAGAFFGALAVTLSIALLVSLVLALLVSPSLCAAFLRTRAEEREHGHLFEKLIIYARVLGGALKSRWVLPVAVLFLMTETYSTLFRLSLLRLLYVALWRF